VSFASTIGATAAIAQSRYFFRDWVRSKLGDRLKTLDDGIKRDGAFYLFGLRLAPVVPFFLINIGMGLTGISAREFYLVSQLGMLLGTAVYVNAGTELGKITAVGDVMTPHILVAFSLLAVVPLVAKKVLSYLKARRLEARFKRPKSYDYNVVVIGAGSGGLVSAYIAAAVKAKVALIEKHKMGGDCLNTGCVPSKALIRSAKAVAAGLKAKDLGLDAVEVKYDFVKVMERVQRVVKAIEPHDSVERYTALGVECISGHAMIKSPFEVEVAGRTLTTKNIVIATGGSPLVPKIPGLEGIDYLTSDNVWTLRERPQHLLILGGGSIGCELAQAFQRLGSKVTLVEMADRILGCEDTEVSREVAARLESEGVRILTKHRAVAFSSDGDTKSLKCQHPDGDIEIGFDRVLLALGRKANVEGFGASELGLQVTDRGRLASDEFLRTNYRNIFVCGDVTGDYQFTHVAAHEAWYASVNALFRPFKKFAADYRVIPMVTFTDPEVARVGLNESEARVKGVPYEVSFYGIDDLDRAIADGEAHGFIKVLTVPGKDKILGVSIVGAHAGELLAEFVLALKYGLGLNKVLSTVHAYPTLVEANKYVAGVWRKAHAPQGILRLLERYHTWNRRG
jgi:pyruvate/2-oxoglutarate dehydrogenase complex dihydrolipoamide dehydrogenase (E3) component